MRMLNNEVITMKKLKISLCTAIFCTIFLVSTVSGSEDPLCTMKYSKSFKERCC